MLKIQCAHCNQILMGKEIKVKPFYVHINEITYQDYAVTCTKCGGAIVWDRYTEKAAENKAKAIRNAANKQVKPVKKVKKIESYEVIMHKVGKRAKELSLRHPWICGVQLGDFYDAINELPPDEKRMVLKYEDKQDIELLKRPIYKTHAKATPQCILLLTQAIFESARDEFDEDFFKSKFGEFVVDVYNAALIAYKNHDYDITAGLLLDKMRKGEWKKGEEEDA